MDDHTAEKVNDFFNNELTPREFSDVLDEAYFVLSQAAISKPDAIATGTLPIDEVLYYLHKFKKVLNNQ